MTVDDKERGRYVGTRLRGSRSRIRRAIAIATGLVAGAGLAVFASGAGASPQPTVAQVQAQINKLPSQFDHVTEQFDQASQQLSGASARLSQVRVELSHADAQFQAAQMIVAQTAEAAFEDTGATSIASVLTSGDPSAILQQGALLMELSSSRNAETQQLLTDASQLTAIEQTMERTQYGISQLKSQLAAHKKSLGQLIATERATLDSLTVPEQQTVKNNTIGPHGATTVTFSGPTSTQADQAVAFS